MATDANPPRPRTYNARMSAPGWGEIYVKIMTIAYNMTIVSSGTKTRYSQTVYTEAVTGGSFTLGLVCSSYAEYERLGKWLQGYGRKVSDPSGGVGPVRVECGSRNFDKVAVPRGTEFGDNVREVAYEMTVSFVGARDPVPLSGEFLSNFVLPQSDDKSLPYYYPAGTQLAGAGKGDDALYNWPPQTPSGGSGPTITSPSNPQQGRTSPTITSPSNPQQPNYGD